MKRLRDLLKSANERKTILLMLGAIIYLGAKVYVLSTPNPNDDEIPDKVKDAVLTVVYDDSDDNQYKYDDEIAFGERS